MIKIIFEGKNGENNQVVAENIEEAILSVSGLNAGIIQALVKKVGLSLEEAMSSVMIATKMAYDVIENDDKNAEYNCEEENYAN